MSVVRPDLRENAWIYDLIFVASTIDIHERPPSIKGISSPVSSPGSVNSASSSLSSSSNPITTNLEERSLDYKQFCECCHSINLKVKVSDLLWPLSFILVSKLE